MAIVTNEKVQEAFSLTLEYRTPGLQDLVSNSNAILTVLKERGGWKSVDGGPTIRVRLLYNETGTYTRYAGYDFLNPAPAELVSDAEFTMKNAAVSVTLPMDEVLDNTGRGQLLNILEVHMDAAEQELQDRFVEDLHSNGTADGGKQIGGLQLAIPTVDNSGTYGGIDRANVPLWRTTAYDVQSDFGSGITQFNAASAKEVLNRMLIQRSRGRKGPSLIAMSENHFVEYQKSLEAIQRINDVTGLGKQGFTALCYYGGNRKLDVVLEGGIGSAMPADVSYLLDMEALKFCYHPQRNFSPLGPKQMPINQDAMVRHIGFRGEVVLEMPLHTAKLFDSNTAA